MVDYATGTAIDPVSNFSEDDVTLKINDTSVNATKFTVEAVVIDNGNYTSYQTQGVTEADVGKTLLTVKILNLKDSTLLGNAAAGAGQRPEPDGHCLHLAEGHHRPGHRGADRRGRAQRAPEEHQGYEEGVQACRLKNRTRSTCCPAC